MLRSILISFFVFCSFFIEAQAATITEFGNIGHNYDLGIVEFNVSQGSTVNIWELSDNDYRISLFDNSGLIASNDDHGINWFFDEYSFGTSPGPGYPGQNIYDASLLATSLLGNYTAVLSYWTNAGNLGDSLKEAFVFGQGSTFSNGGYELHVSGDYVSQGHKVSAVPAPPALWLIISALPGIFYLQGGKLII